MNENDLLAISNPENDLAKALNFSHCFSCAVDNRDSDFGLAFLHVRKLLKRQWILKAVGLALQEYPGAVRKTILRNVCAIDHVGFIGPADTELTFLNTCADNHQFARNHTITDSIIVSKELGDLVGKPAVPTKIFSCRSDVGGIEIFIPSAPKEVVSQWIHRGICNHICFKVLNQECLIKLKDMLATQPVRHAATANDMMYIDFSTSAGSLRLEFSV